MNKRFRIPPIEITKAVRYLKRQDDRMDTLIRQYGPPPLKAKNGYFASLSRAIIFQQLHGKAAASICGRFVTLFGKSSFPTPREVLSMSFVRMRSAGLSSSKAQYIKELAKAFVNGKIRPHRIPWMTADEIKYDLTSIRGVGPWTVDMFLIFCLARPDILPTGDLGIKRGMMRFFHLESLPKPKKMLALSGNWKPFRSAASWYLWRLSEE